MKIKKSDIVLILVAVCVAASCLLLYMRFGRESAGKVVVTVDGKVKGTYSLSDNTEVQINDTNTFVIENREVKMKEANCPDQICVHHKAISKNKETIVCLPNKVVIEITTGTGEEAEMDSVAN